VDVNEKDEFGRTALFTAALNDCVEAADALVNAGAKAAATDAEGCSAVHYACMAGATQVLAKLLRAGAGVDTADAEGRTPAYVGASRRWAPSAAVGVSANRPAERGVIKWIGEQCQLRAPSPDQTMSRGVQILKLIGWQSVRDSG
jgi:hypothetical protein